MSKQLDQDFMPALQWIQDYQSDIDHAGADVQTITLGLLRDEKPVARQELRILPNKAADRNFTYIERHLKTILWAYGGNRILFSGPTYLRERLQAHYAHAATGAFDATLVGKKIYGASLRIEAAETEQIPDARTDGHAIGRNLDGCRIGFDLGGSDRKSAALIDGKVVFSEEVPWDPYFQSDPQYHFNGIMDSLQRAAAHLPRVDAIGGSAAGVYVNNEVRVASLFRGVPSSKFDPAVRLIFKRVQAAWNDVPFIVINDGDVTALAGAMSLNVTGLLGLSMGTSTAAGYVTPEGYLTTWLNELAFVPVDYGSDAPPDEWSGDLGCAVQFFSQQGVARLARLAGLSFTKDLPLAEQLVIVQERMAHGDPITEQIYTTIGKTFGHTLANWTRFYDMQHVLILGRVTSGMGGDLLLEQARTCLQQHYPRIAEGLQLHMPDEKMKRHGQAVAASSLPHIG